MVRQTFQGEDKRTDIKPDHMSNRLKIHSNLAIMWYVIQKSIGKVRRKNENESDRERSNKGEQSD
jgi:hypothetical protein